MVHSCDSNELLRIKQKQQKKAINSKRSENLICLQLQQTYSVCRCARWTPAAGDAFTYLLISIILCTAFLIREHYLIRAQTPCLLLLLLSCRAVRHFLASRTIQIYRAYFDRCCLHALHVFVYVEHLWYECRAVNWATISTNEKTAMRFVWRWSELSVNISHIPPYDADDDDLDQKLIFKSWISGSRPQELVVLLILLLFDH